MFVYVENVFSDEVINFLVDTYAKVLENDNSSYVVWPKEMTNNNTLPEAFSTTVSGADRIKVLNDLVNNQTLPFNDYKKIKSAQLAVQKLLPGCLIPEHNDKCIASLTVFLNKENVNGGEFVWEDKGIEITVVPKYNCGVYALYNEGTVGNMHKVNKVSGDATRYTLQMFI